MIYTVCESISGLTIVRSIIISEDMLKGLTMKIFIHRNCLTNEDGSEFWVRCGNDGMQVEVSN